MATSILRVDARAVAETAGDVEYALFDPQELKMARDVAGRVTEIGYETTARAARERLSQRGVTPELASQAARALRPLVEPYARGTAVRKIAASLEARVWLEPGQSTADTCAGTFLDLAALVDDLGAPSAAKDLQAVFLALLLAEQPAATLVQLDTRAVVATLGSGARTHRRPKLDTVSGLPARLEALARGGVRGARGTVLAPSRALELLRASGVPEAALATLGRQLEAARTAPTDGPLAAPALWEIELLLDAGNYASGTQRLVAVERTSGRSTGTIYLRARIDLLTQVENPRVLAQRVRGLAARDPAFLELTLLSAEASIAARDLVEAEASARKVSGLARDEALRDRAVAVLIAAGGRTLSEPPRLGRGPATREEPSPRRYDHRSEPPEPTDLAVTKNRPSPSQPPIRPPSFAPSAAPRDPRSEPPPAFKISEPATPLDVTRALERRLKSDHPQAAQPVITVGRSGIVQPIPIARIPTDLGPPIPPRMDVDSAPPRASSRPPPAMPPVDGPGTTTGGATVPGEHPVRRRWRGDPVGAAPEPHVAPGSVPSPAPAAARRTDRPPPAPPSGPDVAHVASAPVAAAPVAARPVAAPPVAAAPAAPRPVPPADERISSETALAWGALRPPTLAGTVPDWFLCAPLLSLPDRDGDELAETLPLPLPATVVTAGVGDALPRTVLEARIQFTRLSQELGRQYRARGVELYANASGLEQMQSYLFDRLHGQPFDEPAVRLHGAFLAEVLTRRLLGQWIDIVGNHLGDWQMLLPSGVRVWPFARVARFVERGYRERDLVSYFLELQTGTLLAQR